MGVSITLHEDTFSLDTAKVQSSAYSACLLFVCQQERHWSHHFWDLRNTSVAFPVLLLRLYNSTQIRRMILFCWFQIHTSDNPVRLAFVEQIRCFILCWKCNLTTRIKALNDHQKHFSHLQLSDSNRHFHYHTGRLYKSYRGETSVLMSQYWWKWFSVDLLPYSRNRFSAHQHEIR